jgi:signal transduction histidine kinase
MVDRPKMAQILRNLVSNALKFSSKGSTVQVNCTIAENTLFNSKRFFNENRMLRITVVDSGAGISAENQAKLFMNIIQFHPGVLQGGRGSGLGLYISKGMPFCCCYCSYSYCYHCRRCCHHYSHHRYYYPRPLCCNFY